VLKIAIYVPQNARVQKEAMALGGTVNFLTPGELIAREADGPGGKDMFRAMQYWASKAGCSHMLEYKAK